MDEFRRGLLLQMGANRDRTRRHRAPWLFGAAGTVLSFALVWALGAIVLPAGLFVGGWGVTVFRLSRLNGRERDRLLGQLLVLAGAAIAAWGAWRVLG